MSSHYAHEEVERKANTHPMCTVYPPQSVDEQQGILAHNYLTKRHLSKTLARANGWFVSDQAGDSFTRIVIPAVTHKAGHVYYQARDITGKAFIRYQSPKGPRHEALVRVMPAGVSRGIVVVVEGPMDALAAAGAGYIGFALMGMEPSRATITHLCKLLEAHYTKQILVVLDRDSKECGAKLCVAIASHGHRCALATMPSPEKDLAECLPSKRSKFLAQSFNTLFNTIPCKKAANPNLNQKN